MSVVKGLQKTLRRIIYLPLFFYYLDVKYIFPGVKLLFLQLCFYLFRAVKGTDLASRLFKNVEVVISLKKIMFSVSAVPNDLGRIFECFIKKQYEQIKSFIPHEGDICLDVGTNIGSCALSWFLQNKSGRIICCEPFPDTYRRLSKNILLNKCANIEVFPIALSDKNALLEMFTTEDSSMLVVNAPSKPLSYCIQAYTIDYLIKKESIGKIDICKIDVEGHEMEVLKGAHESLKLIRKLVIEYHSEELKGKVKEILEQDFIVLKVTGKGIGLIFAEQKNKFQN